MRAICFYFQVHQPFRLRTYRFFDIGQQHDYYDEYANRFHIQQIAERSYLPANKILLDLIRKFGDKFRIAFSITGSAMEQFENYAPELIKSFQELAKTGNVEFLAETYMHSLASLKSKDEFAHQVKLHEEKVERLFGIKPKTFRNTELIYNDEIGQTIFNLGYSTVITEGAKHILGWKSPNLLYCSAANPKIKLLLRNFQLTDDMSIRFSVKEWSEYPLTTEKFSGWIKALGDKSEVINLFMDYESFGVKQRKETGIFEFLETLPETIFKNTDYTFFTPSQVAKVLQPASPLHIPYPVSWADEERDITNWLGNEMQNEAFDKLYNLELLVKNCKDYPIQSDWKRLQSSDHFLYMSTKWFSDGIGSTNYNPYNSPYDAFINYMNVLADFEMRVKRFQDQAGTFSIKVPKKRTSKSRTTNKSVSNPKTQKQSARKNLNKETGKKNTDS